MIKTYKIFVSIKPPISCVTSESCKKNFDEFQERFSHYIAGADASHDGENAPEENDAGSDVSSGSSRTSVSSRKKLQNAKAKRLIAEHKLEQLKKKQELERARQELEMKQQLLDQQSEVEEAKLEEMVWLETTQEDSGIISKNQNAQPSVQNKSSDYNRVNNGKDSVLNLNATVNDVQRLSEPEVDRSCVAEVNTQASNIDIAFQRLASTLHEGFNLPKPELLTFDGKPEDYCKFVKNFETNIESRISDRNLKLSYLIQYCTGEAKSSIEDCVLLEAEEGYKRARSILLSRYGRPHIIARSYISNLVHGAHIKASDIEGLSKLSLEMQKCEITLSQLGFSSDIDNSENLRCIVRRLPTHIRVKWVDIAHSINESGREPRFSDLSKFVDEKSRVASSMYGYDLCRNNDQIKRETKTGSGKYNNSEAKIKVTTLSTHTEEKGHESKCNCCSGNCVDLPSCNKFKSMSLSDRCKLVRSLKLCYNCLKGRHFANKCRKPKMCNVPECNLKHHIFLHSWVKPDTGHTSVQSSCNCAATEGSTVKNCLGIVPVIVKGGNGNSCQTYALLDDGADKTLCDERILQILNLTSKSVTFQMSTVSSREGIIHGQEVDLDIRPIDGNDSVTLRKVWSVKNLPISTRSAAKNADICNLPYLSGINIPDINTSDVMLLIGTDSPNAHIPLEVRFGSSDQPYAIRTRLGWAIRGPVSSTQKSKVVNVNYSESRDVLLQRQLERLWTTDFNDRSQQVKSCMSVEDKNALNMMESTINHEDGHYKLGLPWRDINSSFPNDIPLAQARLQQLKRKLSGDTTLHAMYKTAVNDYIDKGYASEVDKVAPETKRVWYLPHHPVTNVNKPGKVRVVFDCAAKYKGISLNSQLLQGPDLMNSLVGVLIKFRQERIAFIADIEAMFHQVRVLEEDRDALRFLWWPNGELDQSPKQYCMNVHLFGATSSPSCAAYALKKTAKDYSSLFKPEVALTVENNFYVDDCLKSVPTEQEAINLAIDLKKMLSMGGFRLTKWLSNSRNVLETIPESDLAKSVVSLSPGEKCNDKALGIIWDVNDDKIKYKVNLEDKPSTRRGILSTISSIFDPLGLISPIMLKAKLIVQKLCKEKLGWDDQVPDRYGEEWRSWLHYLPRLADITIDRCFQPIGFGPIRNAQLHIFSDGSEIGYGACAYLRITDNSGKVACSLVMGKSRLAPIKQISIPRLELSGAVVACRIYECLSEELDTKLDEVTFWTDSMILLGYIRNTSRRFKTFVGNRLSIIHDTTTPNQWRHVNSILNPADVASRGINTSDTEKLNIWLHGPKFLLKSNEQWPKEPKNIIPEVSGDDVEVKREIAIHSTTCDTICKMIEFYSDWNKLRRAVAWLIRYKDYCKQRYLHRDVLLEKGNLTLTDLRKSTNAILVYVQMECFVDEILNLEKGNCVKSDSRLASLNPMLKDGLIRTRGRVNYRYDAECPIVLPKKHHVTTLVIRFYHESQGHVGIQQVLAATRTKYWIINGHSSVKKVVRNCVPCKREKSPLLIQQMAPLLDEQVTPDKPPFTFIGIDYFGPLMVKSGRSQIKRYGCIFSCLTSRAIHLEVAHSLSTDSFIAAFQRFISRRGVPEKVYSDNGTNLVSGDLELRKSIREWNQSEIGQFMLQREIEWHFNPPSASHMGGTWERMIRSTRTILRSLVKEQLLNDEQLLTVITEVEKILNDRPITRVSDDPNDLSALTPSMILLLKSNACIPHGIFRKEDTYAKRRWRQAQYLADVFWRRWIREYIPTLQSRQKWRRPHRDIREGDIVLVAQDNVPRGQWPLGRVISINVGRDGHTRSCMVKTKASQFIRPITKLCLLECLI